MILMSEEKKKCGLYMRVSAEDQAREGFSLPEQRERLETFCKFKGYDIIDYYEDAGISAKTGNYRPEFERLKNDIKAKKVKDIQEIKNEKIQNIIIFIYEIGNLQKNKEINEHLLKILLKGKKVGITCLLYSKFSKRNLNLGYIEDLVDYMMNLILKKLYLVK